MGLGFDSAPVGELPGAVGFQVEKEQIGIVVDAHGQDHRFSVGGERAPGVEGALGSEESPLRGFGIVAEGLEENVGAARAQHRVNDAAARRRPSRQQVNVRVGGNQLEARAVSVGRDDHLGVTRLAQDESDGASQQARLAGDPLGEAVDQGHHLRFRDSPLQGKLIVVENELLRPGIHQPHQQHLALPKQLQPQVNPLGFGAKGTKPGFPSPQVEHSAPAEIFFQESADSREGRISRQLGIDFPFQDELGEPDPLDGNVLGRVILPRPADSLGHGRSGPERKCRDQPAQGGPAHTLQPRFSRTNPSRQG